MRRPTNRRWSRPAPTWPRPTCAIWSAERLYWLTNQQYSSDLTELQSLGLLDPTVVAGSNMYAYAIVVADSSTFQASAVRTGSSIWSGELTVDQTGAISGTITGFGQPNIQPGFQ